MHIIRIFLSPRSDLVSDFVAAPSQPIDCAEDQTVITDVTPNQSQHSETM